MAEDIIDFHLHEESGAEVTPPAGEASPATGFVTKEELRSFGEEMAAQIAAALRPAEPAAPEAPIDWELQFANRAADTATARLLEVNKPIFAAQIAEQVEGEFGQDVKAEILEEMKGLPGHVVARITQSPADLQKLARMARGIYAEKHGVQAPISKASGTTNGATVGENDEAERYFLAYKDIGVTRDMARQWARGGK